MNGLMRVLGRRDVKGLALAGAANFVMGRVARRSPTAARGVRLMRTASWAVPLGMMAYDRIRSRRHD